MNLLRIVLLIASVIGSLAMIVLSKMALSNGDSTAVYCTAAFAVALGLNALVLYEGHKAPDTNRVRRMFALWLDAKEQDLKRRATDRAG